MRDTYLVSFSLAVFLDLVLHSEKTRVIDACVKRDAYLNGALCVLGGLRSRALSMSPFFLRSRALSMSPPSLFHFLSLSLSFSPSPSPPPLCKRSLSLSLSISLSPCVSLYVRAHTCVSRTRSRSLAQSFQPLSLSRLCLILYPFIPPTPPPVTL